MQVHRTHDSICKLRSQLFRVRFIFKPNYLQCLIKQTNKITGGKCIYKQNIMLRLRYITN
jgi:hypothetical protein